MDYNKIKLTHNNEISFFLSMVWAAAGVVGKERRQGGGGVSKKIWLKKGWK